jgi:MFS transporter, FSR family, fosmidomycin resistance protein
MTTASTASTATSAPPGRPAYTPLRPDADVMGLVGIAHLISHFSQLLLAPLFPWLKTEFGVSYTELAFLLTLFFVVSCAAQAASGFWVDRYGPRPILFAGLALLGIAAFGYAISTSYWMLAAFAVVAGAGNGVFHPVNYTLLNRKISAHRLGHAYSVHGITGSLGWALAPAMMVGLTYAYSWRVAVAAAGVLTFSALALLVVNRHKLTLSNTAASKGAQTNDSSFAFLRIPAVWMCFSFFFWYAAALSVVQAFAPEAARQLHHVPVALVALCLTIYMLASAGGMVLGGFLAADPSRCERIVGTAFAVAAGVAVLLAVGQFGSAGQWVVPTLFGVMGFASGIAGPSRDLLVKRSTPDNASGRVYGVVYAGLDIGQAVAPVVFGLMMDNGQYRSVLLGLAVLQGVLIVSAFNVRRVRRTAKVGA